MAEFALSSPALREHKPGIEWKTPEQGAIRLIRRQGKSYGQIKKETGLERSTIQRIVNAQASKRARKGKATKKKLISATDLKRVLHFVSLSWTNRCMPYARLVKECRINASTTTLRRALKAAGYRRCIACRRPFISEEQAVKRVAFCLKYRWWSVKSWKRVLWSDEATFKTGKRGRIYVTCRPEEKNCRTCI
jgi:transposase